MKKIEMIKSMMELPITEPSTFWQMIHAEALRQATEIAVVASSLNQEPTRITVPQRKEEDEDKKS